jgi:hypothetical protein
MNKAYRELVAARDRAADLAKQLNCSNVTEFMRLGKNVLVDITVIRARLGVWKDNHNVRTH